MPVTTLHQSALLRVDDYRCAARRGEPSLTEQHGTTCLAFVRKGSFGYRVQGRAYELVPGCVLLGRQGDEYRCTHDHHAGGDECLSFHFGPELTDELSLGTRAFQLGSVPPLPELMVLGELAQAAAEGRNELGLDEAGILLAARWAQLASDRAPPTVRVSPRDLRRVTEAALWLEANAGEEVTLADSAGLVGLSSYHFLRLFKRVLGVSPHQYLVRLRLGRAARLLAEEALPITQIAYEVGFGDLSNFVRTFGRAAGLTPSAFRRLSRGERALLQQDLRPSI
jgi:AraC family transcriptional regulator